MSKIAFLFPGQGAQSVGMGRELIETLPAARRLFADAADVLGYDLARICLDGPADKLNSTVFSQPALFVASLAAREALEARFPEEAAGCQAAAGLSLGEYTALVVAGVLDFASGVKLVQARGEAMQAAADAAPSGMVSVLGLDEAVVRGLCDEARQQETLAVANLLCPGNIAVSGSRQACARLAARAEQAGAMAVVPLAVAGAFHTCLMQPAAERLAEVLAQVPMRRAEIPVISNVDAQPHHDPEEIRELLVRQIVQPVLWEASVRWLLGGGFDRFYEIGPGRVLRGLLRRIDRKVPCESVAA